MKHFKERIDKIFPHCRPYSCPNSECTFEGKDKQALLRHYTGKHGVLELYLKEALMARGINYHLSDSAKRKSMGHNQDTNKAKHARMSPPIETTTLPPSPYQEEPMLADTTTILPSEYSEPITYQHQQSITRLPTIPTTKLPSMSTVFTKTKPTQSEVDAMIASFEPSEYQISATVFPHQPVITTQSLSEQPIGSHIVSSTTLDLPTLFLPLSDESSKLILDNNIMWGSGSSSFSLESNQTVPVQYLETSETGFVNLGDIDYDYLYPATVDPCAVQASSNNSSSSSQTILPFTDL